MRRLFNFFRPHRPNATPAKSESATNQPSTLPAEDADLAEKRIRLKRRLISNAIENKAAVDAAIDEIVALHIHTLVAKRRKTTYTDDYGREIIDDWITELFYFYDTVVETELANRGMEKRIGKMELEWVLNQSDVPEIREYLATHNNIRGYFKQKTLLYIAELVDECDSQIAPPPVDILQISPEGYEEYCAEELRTAGWDARVTAGTGDQGVDIVAIRGDTVAVFQCKLYSTPLGNKPVQEVYTGQGFYDAHIAAVISNADYTPGARAAARQTGVLLLHHTNLRQFGSAEAAESPADEEA